MGSEDPDQRGSISSTASAHLACGLVGHVLQTPLSISSLELWGEKQDFLSHFSSWYAQATATPRMERRTGDSLLCPPCAVLQGVAEEGGSSHAEALREPNNDEVKHSLIGNYNLWTFVSLICLIFAQYYYTVLWFGEVFSFLFFSWSIYFYFYMCLYERDV